MAKARNEEATQPGRLPPTLTSTILQAASSGKPSLIAPILSPGMDTAFTIRHAGLSVPRLFQACSCSCLYACSPAELAPCHIMSSRGFCGHPRWSSCPFSFPSKHLNSLLIVFINCLPVQSPHCIIELQRHEDGAKRATLQDVPCSILRLTQSLAEIVGTQLLQAPRRLTPRDSTAGLE